MGLPRLGPIWTSLAVGALLLCFGGLSFTAVLGKSATYDEPLHVVGGMVHRYADDFRINPEDPALFGWWASLPQGRNALPIDTASPFYKAATSDSNQQWWFVIDTLYEHNAAHADRFLDTSRAMFVILGMGLGALIACWAYQIGGCWAAIAAAVLFCFDPNFLAHSALVKNDVMLSLMMCLLGFFLWRFGRDGGWYWLALAALACGLAFNVKFSAVLFGPMAVLLLAIRALLPSPWSVCKRLMRNWRQRVAVVGIGAGAMLLAIYLLTWCIYGFRYNATANGQPLLSTPLVIKSVRNNFISRHKESDFAQISNQDFQAMVEERVRNEDFALPVKVDLWMQKHHVLPEGWLFGFLYTYANTLVRSTYLLGTVAVVGRWYYFPLAILFKTPAGTLAAAIAIPLALLATRWVGKPVEIDEDEAPVAKTALDWWTLLALTIPPGIYFVTALTTNLNLGLRHILPIYPYVFIALGVGAAALLERRPKAGTILCGVLVAGLLAETIITYPNYLAFFNVFSGGSEGGYRLLGDSNLDWGQDLPALAAWNKGHPTDKLYLCYFGMADPRVYGIDFVNLPGGVASDGGLIGAWPFLPAGNLDANQPGVIAISATNLQGIYMGQPLADRYKKILNGEKPLRILDGTIYLYSWPPTPPQQSK